MFVRAHPTQPPLAWRAYFWWQGKVEIGTEVLMLFKTTTHCMEDLEKLVVAKHPYDTPEFVVVSPHSGSERYLNWLAGSVKRTRGS